MASLWSLDFESGTPASTFNAVAGTAALSFTSSDAAVGTQSFQCNAVSGTQSYGAMTLSGNVVTTTFWYKPTTLPATGATSILHYVANTGGDFKLRILSTGKLSPLISTGSSPIDSKVLVVGTWYRIDVMCDASTTTYTMKYKVDGVDGSTVTFGVASAKVHIQARLGCPATVPQSGRFDKFAGDSTAAAYPIRYSYTRSVATTGASAPTLTRKVGTAIPIILVDLSTGSVFDVAGADLSLPLPDQVSVGNVMLAQVEARPGNSVITPPAGWTQLTNLNDGTLIRQGVYYKIAGTADLSTVDPTTGDLNTPTATWTTDIATGVGGGIIAYSGVDTANPIEASSVGNAGGVATTIVTAPSVVTTEKGAAVAYFAAIDNAVLFTPAAGWSEVYDQKVLASPRNSDFTASWKIPAAAGTVPATSETANGSGVYVASMIVLRAGFGARTSVALQTTEASTASLARIQGKITKVALANNTQVTAKRVTRRVGKKLTSAGGALGGDIQWFGFAHGQAVNLATSNPSQVARWLSETAAIYGNRAVIRAGVNATQNFTTGAVSIPTAKLDAFANLCANAGVKWIPQIHHQTTTTSRTASASNYATPTLTGTGAAATMGSYQATVRSIMDRYAAGGSYVPPAGSNWITPDIFELWNEPQSATGNASNAPNADGDMTVYANGYRVLKAGKAAADAWVAGGVGRTAPKLIAWGLAAGTTPTMMTYLKGVLDYARTNSLPQLNTLVTHLGVHVYSPSASDLSWPNTAGGTSFSGTANPINTSLEKDTQINSLGSDVRPCLDAYGCTGTRLAMTEGGFSGSDQWNKYQLNFGGFDASGASSTSKLKSSIVWATPRNSAPAPTDDFDQKTLVTQAISRIKAMNASQSLGLDYWINYTVEDPQTAYNATTDYTYWQNSRGAFLVDKSTKPVALAESTASLNSSSGYTAQVFTTKLTASVRRVTLAAVEATSGTMMRLAKKTLKPSGVASTARMIVAHRLTLLATTATVGRMVRLLKFRHTTSIGNVADVAHVASTAPTSTPVVNQGRNQAALSVDSGANRVERYVDDGSDTAGG